MYARVGSTLQIFNAIELEQPSPFAEKTGLEQGETHRRKLRTL
jgi:hypothetical protein